MKSSEFYRPPNVRYDDCPDCGRTSRYTRHTDGRMYCQVCGHKMYKFGDNTGQSKPAITAYTGKPYVRS